MKKILVLFAIVLGLTGCSTPVTPEVEEPTQVEAVGKKHKMLLKNTKTEEELRCIEFRWKIQITNEKYH